MRFAWPLALLSLLIVPLLLGAYVLQLRRRRRSAVRFSSIALVRAALPKGASWKRHVPVGLFLAALATLGVAAGRPQASMRVPFGQTSIMLALDVSRSMCATDVEPNRLAVAQDAAREFVKNQPRGTRIGLVAFAGFAEVVVAPTTDRDELASAIDAFTTARGTAIGAATLKSIDAIAATNPDVKPVDSNLFATGEDAFDPFDPNGPGFDTGEQVTEKAPEPKNGYVPDIVVLLTDGANTRGIQPVVAAKQAAERRIRVYTIGFGTDDPTELSCTPEQLGGEAFGDRGFGGGGGGFGGGAPRQFLVIDEPTLRSVANLTGGVFYKAEDAGQLTTVFKDLPKTVRLQTRDVEIAAGFAVGGALLALAAMVLSLRWNRF
jgi:Ca-activated chloride channel homolog